MRVAREISNTQAIADLAPTKIFALLDLPQDQREEFIQNNPIEDMTTRELQKAIKEKKNLELEKQRLETAYNELSVKFSEVKNKPSEVVEVVVEVDNTDYNKINQLTKQLEFAEKQKAILEREVKLNESEAKAYKELKESIDKLKLEREDIHRQIESATSISKFVVDIEDTLQTKLAPIKYSRAISEQLNNEVVINNILEIVGRVEDWCVEMREIISKDENVINIEYTEVE